MIIHQGPRKKKDGGGGRRRRNDCPKWKEWGVNKLPLKSIY